LIALSIRFVPAVLVILVILIVLIILMLAHLDCPFAVF